MDKYIIIYHKDWQGECNIENDIISRIDTNNENGKIEINEKNLSITWVNWDKEYFIYLYKNIYIEKEFFKSLNVIYLIKDDKKYILLFNKYNKCINNDTNYDETNINYKEKNYVKLIDNIYIYENYILNYFFIETINFNIKKTYILDKIKNNFFEKDDIMNEGNYFIDNNILHLKWNNGIEKKFLSNIYYEYNKLNYENIKVIKPNKFIIENRILFGNITMIKNKIYLSSIYYKKNPWKINNIIFNIKNNNIIKKKIIEYKNYESCIIIILELEKKQKNIELEILYKEHSKKFDLSQFNIPSNLIYAVTLFKNDYQLLKKYLEYYDNLGVNCFFLYYNDEINSDFINEINIINQSKYQIILVEWKYEYWYYYNEKEKHHHAQVMAINDSLYILKNYCKYILYNDLDEYINLDYSFNDLIESNKNVDVFEFKCMFCKMGETLIKYRNFYFEYNKDNIIEGNFWDKFREKNLINVNKVNLMGVHEPVYDYNEKKIKKKYITYFYHFINFYEKNRLELMNQYIS